MSTDHTAMDERLNAFVDGQLHSDERAEVIADSQADEAMAASTCELRHLKEMVELAYQDVPMPAPRRPRTGLVGRHLMTAAAAAALLGIGLSVGWLAHGRLMGDAARSLRQIAQASPAQADGTHVVLHIATDDPARVNAALDDAEDLLKTYSSSHRKVRLEVIANAEGINLLRAGYSPYAARIEAMTKRYDNIAFLACRRAIDRMRTKGVDVHLIPDVKVVPEALDAIVSRLRKGWVYIRA